MNIVKQSVEILTNIDPYVIQFIEKCGRTCYKSEDKITQNSAEQFVKNIMKSGHESVIEHYNVTVKFICDRGISHEIVRHRLASYSQESTRYCNYSKNGEITVIEPYFKINTREQRIIWTAACQQAENYYFVLLKAGASPQEARAVLPNSLKTEVVMTANLREWRHFIKMRSASSAHPQIRELSLNLLEEFKSKIPIIFDDLGE